MTREEVKKKIYDKKVKKALRSYRFRPFKNFVFWFAGVLSSVAVVVGSIFIGVKVVPIKTYTGGKEEGYVSEEIASKSILDALLNYNKYGMEDIPGIRDSIVESIAGSIAGNYITVDADKLSTVKFNLDKDGGKEMIEGLLNSITLNPEGLSSVNEGVSNLSVFNDYEEAQPPAETSVGGELYILDTAENNPKLYYYEVDESQQGGGNEGFTAQEPPQNIKKYARAYDDNGKRLAPLGVKVYYPALKDVPILDITQMIDKFVERIDIGEVVSVILPKKDDGNENVILGTLVDALSGQKISNLDNLATNLLSKFTISGLLGDTEVLKNLLNVNIFTWGNEVDNAIFEGKTENGNIKVDAENSTDEKTVYMLNPALFYYYNATKEQYIRAFDNNGVRTASESDKLYYANLLEIPITELLSVFGASLEILELSELFKAFDVKFDEGSLLDVLLSGVTVKNFTDKDGMSNLLNKLTLTSFGIDLGALGNLSIFNQWEQVDLADMPIKSGENQISSGANPKLYYYVVDSTDVGEGGNLNDTAYARAFNDDGSVVSQAITSETTLFYAKLSAVGFIDMAGLIPARLGKLPVLDLLTALGGASFEDGDLFKLVLGDKTVSELGDISGSQIYLHWLLPHNDTTKATYELILNALDKDFTNETIKQVAESITIEDLSKTKLDFNNIAIGQYVDNSTLTLICNAINKYRTSEEYKTANGGVAGKQVGVNNVSIGDMKDFSPDYIALSAVAGSMNDDIKALIKELVDETDFNEITVKQLSSINPDNISLSRFITDSRTLSLIRDAINEYRNSSEYKDLNNGVAGTQISGTDVVTVGDIKDFKPDYILLSNVANLDENVQKLIGELVGGTKTFAQITVKDLGSFNVSNVSLATAMGNTEIDETLKEFLEEATETDFAQIKISALGNLNISNVRLSTAMPSVNSELKKLIQQITNNSNYDAIKISDLSGTLYVDNIDLSIILGEYDSNKILYNILLEASNQEANKTNAEALKASSLKDFDLKKVKLNTALTEQTGNVIIDTLRADETVNLGNIGEKINGLKLYEVFGNNCFTTNESEKVEGTHQFKLENGAYVHVTEAQAEEIKNNGGDVYYIHKNDGIWLLICFEFGDINQTGDDAGRPDEYRISSKTLGDLMKTNEGDNNFMSVALTKATLRQLMDAGMITVENSKLYTKTLTDIISMIDKIAKDYPHLLD